MINKLNEKIASLDIFGYRIELNFGKKGWTHNSSCGGIVTIIIMASLISFGLYRIYVMFTFSQSNMSSVTQP